MKRLFLIVAAVLGVGMALASIVRPAAAAQASADLLLEASPNAILVFWVTPDGSAVTHISNARFQNGVEFADPNGIDPILRMTIEEDNRGTSWQADFSEVPYLSTTTPRVLPVASMVYQKVDDSRLMSDAASLFNCLALYQGTPYVCYPNQPLSLPLPPRPLFKHVARAN